MSRARLSTVLAALAAVLVFCGRAEAIPLLQLDIGNGVYNTVDQTIYATTNSFTLYAYLTPPTNSSPGQISQLLSQTYYLAAAVTPKVSTPKDLGSFTFNGQTVNATADMVYGVPPIETYLGGIATDDSGDLTTHDIYDTYFTQFSFNFSPTQRATPYDTEYQTGTGPTPDPSGGMYYMAFTVDTSKLSKYYQIHFDLYSETVNGTDVDINKFAPVSHDAQSRVMPVPEPASLILLGSGITGLAVRRRRSAR